MTNMIVLHDRLLTSDVLTPDAHGHRTQLYLLQLNAWDWSLFVIVFILG